MKNPIQEWRNDNNGPYSTNEIWKCFQNASNFQNLKLCLSQHQYNKNSEIAIFLERSGNILEEKILCSGGKSFCAESELQRRSSISYAQTHQLCIIVHILPVWNRMWNTTNLVILFVKCETSLWWQINIKANTKEAGIHLKHATSYN